MSKDLEEKVKKIIGNVFNLEPHLVSEATSSDTVSKWDSLGHMNLVVALEEEFRIQFSDVQIVEMMNYSLILCVVKEILIK